MPFTTPQIYLRIPQNIVLATDNPERVSLQFVPTAALLIGPDHEGLARHSFRQLRDTLAPTLAVLGAEKKS